MQVSKKASIQVCNYTNIRVIKCYASMQACRYASMQVCDNAHICKYVSMQVCKYVSMRIYANM